MSSVTAHLENPSCFPSFSKWLCNHGRHLTSLHIYHTDSHWPQAEAAEALRHCSSIQHLLIELAKDTLEQLCINALASLQQLRSLELNAVQSDADLSPLPPQLQQLTLFYESPLTAATAAVIIMAIGHLRHLEVFCCHNVFHDIELAALTALSKLQAITLRWDTSSIDEDVTESDSGSSTALSSTGSSAKQVMKSRWHCLLQLLPPWPT